MRQEEEDLDDLDSLLPQFASGTTDDFPDPDEPELGPSTAHLPAKPTTASSAGAAADADADVDPDLMAQLAAGLSPEEAVEFKQMMKELLETGLPGIPGLPGLGEDEMNNELMRLLGGASGAPEPATTTTTTNASDGKGKGKGKAPINKGNASTVPAPPPVQDEVDFQSTISSTLSKLRSTASSASAAATTAAEGANDPLAALMEKMGMPGLSGEGGEEGMQEMLDGMMGQLMSRELLYEPMKELSDKYPEYLASKGPSLPKADLSRFKLQQTLVKQIVAAFEEPGADDPEGGTEEIRKERSTRVIELVAKMNECGSPPEEIMGEMPEG